jgi:hypothetical protein
MTFGSPWQFGLCCRSSSNTVWSRRTELMLASSLYRPSAARGGGLLLAVSVRTRWRQEAGLRSDGPASQSQLAAIPGETRSRPLPDGHGRPVLSIPFLLRRPRVPPGRRTRARIWPRPPRQPGAHMTHPFNLQASSRTSTFRWAVCSAPNPLRRGRCVHESILVVENADIHAEPFAQSG